jgi:hypothetical protein
VVPVQFPPITKLHLNQNQNRWAKLGTETINHSISNKAKSEEGFKRRMRKKKSVLSTQKQW